MRTVKAAPQASMLMESIRDIGYSLPMALADVIDNAITANASTIQMFARIEEDSKPQIGILDNGTGMTEEQLLKAMRLGSFNPLDERNRDDLGRFGLGLKTASFSQCRRLTVVTRQGSRTSTAVWDLDLVAKMDEWLVEMPENLDLVPWAELLDDHGTLIVWEKFDRLKRNQSEEIDIAQFTHDIDQALEHLEIVFHRFLAGEPGIKKLDIHLNGRPLHPFDPFHSKHPATIAAPKEVITVQGYPVEVQAFTLPHHSKVERDAYERYALPKGYLQSQGFYVYRARRLIIHGSWFGLLSQQELTKLSRIQVDIPNGLDTEWKIDIMKSSVQIPSVVRNRLRRVIDKVVGGSKRTYTGRGRRLLNQDPLPVWYKKQDKNEISYHINIEHPILDQFYSSLPNKLKIEFAHLLKICESALPLPSLYADMGNHPKDTITSGLSQETLLSAIRTTVANCLKAGIEEKKIIDMLNAAEPFRSNWGQAEAYIHRILAEASTNV